MRATTHEHPRSAKVRLTCVLVASIGSLTSCAHRSATDTNPQLDRAAAPIIWQDPGRLELRDLRYGPGSPARTPRAPFSFIEENRSGTSPKFLVKDARGVEWVVKLGPEAQSETAATRLLWAVGYFADEAYYLPSARIHRLPVLSRGLEFVRPNGVVTGARFEPRTVNQTRIDTWAWDDNPFVGTRELDGLRVMMVLLNNWDARDANNQIVLTGSRRAREARYLVSDLGATLGRTGGKGTHSKNNVSHFVESRFVERTTNDSMEFDYDTRPAGLMLASVVYPPYFLREFSRENKFDEVPLAHARWIGALLARLTAAQLHQAFLAAGYEGPVATAYVTKLRERIRELAPPKTVLLAKRGQTKMR